MENVTNKIKEILSNHHKRIVGEEALTPAAVLIPLFIKDKQIHLLFTLRTNKVQDHKGQVSFPGGAWEKDDQDLLATALRESNEEIGLKPVDVEVLGEVDNLITTSGFVVSPFVGVIPYPYRFQPCEDEIAEIFSLPLSHFLDKNNLELKQREWRGRMVDVYYYNHGKHLIWGVTAKILKSFLDLLREQNSPMLNELPFVTNNQKSAKDQF